MLNLLGAISLGLLALVSWSMLIRASTTNPQVRRRAALGVLAWFSLIFVLSFAGILGLEGAGTFVIGAAVMTPIIVGLVLAAGSPSLRAVALGIPLAGLVALHTGRVLGAFFLILESAGRLPPTFAHAAGWGDIAVGITAVPVAWAIHRGWSGWPALALAWNTLGLLDLIVAVSLGVGSADSPLRFIYESPASGTIGTLPWALIPGFLVPTYVLIHLAIFAQIRRAWTTSGAPRPARV